MECLQPYTQDSLKFDAYWKEIKTYRHHNSFQTGLFDLVIWVFPKIGWFSPKMDGENHGKPYEQMDDLGGVKPPIFGLTPL